MITQKSAENEIFTSQELKDLIAGQDFSGCSAVVVGLGYMGREFVKALQVLRVGKIGVCSRSEEKLAQLKAGTSGIEIISGGYERLKPCDSEDALAIVATPTESLVPATRHLIALGYKKLLIEKPVSFEAVAVEELTQRVALSGAKAAVAYNRVAYPSYHEARARVAEEGGITSCSYAFTELIHKIDARKFPEAELARWGVANSLHVMSMAHGLIGLPKTWSVYRRGFLSWHPTGNVFVGSGISEGEIPFACHADWGSTGRWSLEVHTRMASYLFCPLESLSARKRPLGNWEEVPVAVFAPEVKTGVTEETAAMLSQEVRRVVPLYSLQKTAILTRFGEDIFGYRSSPAHAALG